MKLEDLSAQDQALIGTDFGELDKVAGEMVKEAGECYERGFEKTALEIADSLDKVAEEDDKKEDEHKLDDESEKKAAQLGAFYERGVFDGLAKLGEARHGDPMHYFMPFIEEKVAEGGMRAALNAFGSKARTALHGLHPKAVAEHGRKAMTGERKPLGAIKSLEKKIVGRSGESGEMTDQAANRLKRARDQVAKHTMGGKERAGEGAKAVGKAALYGAGAAAVAKGVHSAASDKKK